MELREKIAKEIYLELLPISEKTCYKITDKILTLLSDQWVNKEEVLKRLQPCVDGKGLAIPRIAIQAVIVDLNLPQPPKEGE